MIPGYEATQAALDRSFPGVELEYNPHGYYVLTDRATYPGGLEASDARMTPDSHLRAMHGVYPINRGTIFALEEDGEPVPPSIDLILQTLYRSFHGQHEDGVDQQIERLDGLEDLEQAATEARHRESAREAADYAWNRKVGKVFSSSSGTTSSTKAARDRELQRRSEDLTFAGDLVD